jgi:hypothetical protein
MIVESAVLLPREGAILGRTWEGSNFVLSFKYVLSRKARVCREGQYLSALDISYSGSKTYKQIFIMPIGIYLQMPDNQLA